MCMTRHDNKPRGEHVHKHFHVVQWDELSGRDKNLRKGTEIVAKMRIAQPRGNAAGVAGRILASYDNYDFSILRR